MKPLALAILIFLILFRLDAWKERRRELLRFCNEAQAAVKTKKYPVIIGSPAVSTGDRMKLIGARSLTEGVDRGREVGEVFLGPSLDHLGLELGQRVLLSGAFRCEFPRRNPGRQQDGFHFFERPRIFLSRATRIRLLPEAASPVVRLRSRFLQWLTRLFEVAPGWRGLEIALWTGDSSGLPLFLREFYHDEGLLHFLALSGLRVMGLVLVFSTVTKLAFLISYRRWGAKRCGWYRYVRRLLPLFACLTLCLTARGPAPVIRMTAMGGAWAVLSLRRFECSTLQRIGSSVAVLILWEPELVANPGFFWSVVATALLCEAMGQGSLGALGEYLFLMVVMPILVFPLSAFSSAKLAPLAPLHSVVLGGIWEFILIPVGYSAPIILACLPRGLRLVTLKLGEAGWQAIVKFHEGWHRWVHFPSVSVIRLTWGEMILFEFLFLVVAIYFRERILQRKLRTSRR